MPTTGYARDRCQFLATQQAQHDLGEGNEVTAAAGEDTLIVDAATEGDAVVDTSIEGSPAATVIAARDGNISALLDQDVQASPPQQPPTYDWFPED